MNNRANIHSHELRVRSKAKGEVEKRRVHVYEDHRTILNILDHFRRANAAAFPVNIVYFDHHDDARVPTSLPAARSQIRNGVTARDFWSFVEWDTDPLDGDWLKTGMDVGLIQDAVLVGGRDVSNVGAFPTQYNDVAGQEHSIYSVDHIWSGLQSNSWLVDAAKQADLKPVWDILGWQNEAGKFSFASQRDGIRRYVLDFDLDYFTSKGPTGIGPVPWTYAQIASAFYTPVPHDDISVGFRPVDFLQLLATHSYFITIAKESPYCGGYRASTKLLRILDELLFAGQLSSCMFK